MDGKERVKQAILNYILEKDQVTYIEVERIFNEHSFEFKGDRSITSGMNEFVVLWNGWNKEAINIVNELFDARLIKAEPTQPINYIIDGGDLNLPLVKGVHRYKEDHWLPVALRPIR